MHDSLFPLARSGAWLLLLACGCSRVGLAVRPPAPQGVPPAAAGPGRPLRNEEAAIESALQYVHSAKTGYKISPADLLEITVYQEPDMSRKVRVGPDGIITFPLVGKFSIGGLSVPDGEELVTEKLKRFLIGPQVSIFIQEYGNKQVYVLGEVQKPGSYPLPTEAPLSVIEAITLAGGFTQYAAPDRTRVIRNAEGKSENHRVEVSAITKRGDKSKDLHLLPNDVIYVPETYF